MPSYSRLEIAERQLERALQLYFDERDHLAAITLASAAEAILERLLEADRAPVAGREPKRASQFARRWRTYFRHKSLIEIAEAVRTGLRHLPDEDASFDPEDVARDVLERAIEKHVALTGQLSPRMRRFRALGLDQATHVEELQRLPRAADEKTSEL